MAFPKGMKLSKSEVSQTIDLDDYFEGDISESNKKLFAEKLIEEMNIRATSGEDYRGTNFVEYTEKYADKKGVGRGDVDMVLNADMLPSIDYEINSNEIKIDVGDGEAAKAYGHMSGFKGHPTIKNGPQRLFFGFLKKDISNIAKDIKKNIKTKPKTKVAGNARQKRARQQIQDIFKGL